MHHPKRELGVTLKLTNGSAQTGLLYLYQDERLIDLLNDERRFIPFFSKQEQRFLFVNKGQIEYVRSLEELSR